MIGLELSRVPGTCVHVTIMSGLELLTNSTIVGTICYEAPDWQGPAGGIRTERREADQVGS